MSATKAPAFLPDGTAGLDRIPPDFNGRLLEDDWDRFEEITENSKRRLPVMEEVKITQADQRAGGVHARQRVLPRRDRGAWLLRRRGVLRARARGRGRHRPGDRRVDRRGRAESRPLGDGHPPVRLPVPLALPTARIRETYETYYDIRYPNHERSAGRPLRMSPGERLARRARRRVRGEVGLGAGQLVRVERRRGDESLRPRGWAGSTGRLRSAPSIGRRAKRWRSSTRARSRSWRSRARRRRNCWSGCATTGSRARWASSPTPRCSTARRDRCDFTVARLGPGRFSIVTGTAFGNHDREWIRKHLPDDGGAQVRDVTSAWACFGIWGPRARDVLRR